MPAQNITQVTHNLLTNQNVSMSTLCAPIIEKSEFYNPNVVKVNF